MRFSIVFASLLAAAPALAAPIRHTAAGSHPHKYQNQHEERGIDTLEERAPHQGRGHDLGKRSPSPSPARGNQRDAAREKAQKKQADTKSTKTAQDLAKQKEADAAQMLAKQKEAEAKKKSKREIQTGMLSIEERDFDEPVDIDLMRRELGASDEDFLYF